MRRPIVAPFLVTACLAATVVAAAPAVAPPRTVKEFVFRPGPAAVVVARMGAAWSEESRYHAGDLREIRFLRKAAPAVTRAKLLLTPMVTLPDDRLVRDPTVVHDAVTKQAADMLAQSVEKSLPIQERVVGGARLIVFTSTDAHPGPGEFLRATQGLVILDGLPFSLTVLHDDVATADAVLGDLSSWSGMGAVDVVRSDVQPNPKQLEALCRKGDGLMCGLANELGPRKGGEKAAVARLTAGCKEGSAFACAGLGGLYAEGKGVPKDDKRAMEIFVKACDGHDSLACLNAAQMVQRKQPGAQGPVPEVFAYLDRACGIAGDINNVCRMSAQTDLTAEAYHRWQTDACAKGDGRACRLLGWAIETGYGTRTDAMAARVAYEKACAHDDLWGCFRQALLTADPTEQARLYQVACDKGSGPACYGLAQPKYGRAPAARRTLLRQACARGVRPACNDVLADAAGSPSR